MNLWILELQSRQTSKLMSPPPRFFFFGVCAEKNHKHSPCLFVFCMVFYSHDCDFHMLLHAEFWDGHYIYTFKEKDISNIRKIWIHKWLNHLGIGNYSASIFQYHTIATSTIPRKHFLYLRHNSLGIAYKHFFRSMQPAFQE